MKIFKILSAFQKKAFVILKLDDLVASIYSKYPQPWLYKFIPTWNYYSDQDFKIIKRASVLFSIQPADYSQWSIFASQIDPHIEVAKKLIKNTNDGIILDVGANCGLFGISIADYYSKRGIKKQVYCYEPNPNVFERLKSNVERNPTVVESITLKNIGLGSEKGQLHLQIPKRNSGAGSVLRDYNNEPHDDFLIDISTIDEQVLSFGTLVDFIKIDVENFEFFVLMGAKFTISTYHPVIFFEVGPGQLRQSDIFSFLSDNGYKFYQIRSNSFVGFEFDGSTTFNSIDNIVAIRG